MAMLDPWIECLKQVSAVVPNVQMFALHNIRKIRPFLTEHAAQLLARPLSFLGWTTAMLFGWTSIKHNQPLQMIQNAAARLVFNEPKRAHVTHSLCLLALATSCSSHPVQTLMLTYRTTTGSAPTYFHSLLRIYIPSGSLRSASERRLVVPSQRGLKSLSRTFSFTIPVWWNDLPSPSGMLDPVNLQATTENSSLSTLLDFIIKKYFPFFYILIFLLTLLACIYLNNAWDWVLGHFLCLFASSRWWIALCIPQL